MPSVLNVACSSASCIQVAMASGSPPATGKRARAGSPVVSSAGVAPGKTGKSAGTVSQIRPHPVSVWPAAGALDGADVPAVLSGGDGDVAVGVEVVAAGP